MLYSRKGIIMSDKYNKTERESLAKLLYNESVAARSNGRNMFSMSNDDMRNWDDEARRIGGWGPNYDYSRNVGTADEYGHLSDSGKLPNHVTFSDESAYHSVAPSLAGTWDRNKYHMTKNGATENRLNELQFMLNNGFNDGSVYVLPDGNRMKANSPAVPR